MWKESYEFSMIFTFHIFKNKHFDIIQDTSMFTDIYDVENKRLFFDKELNFKYETKMWFVNKERKEAHYCYDLAQYWLVNDKNDVFFWMDYAFRHLDIVEKKLQQLMGGPFKVDKLRKKVNRLHDFVVNSGIRREFEVAELPRVYFNEWRMAAKM